jgi:hypothetical protein
LCRKGWENTASRHPAQHHRAVVVCEHSWCCAGCRPPTQEHSNVSILLNRNGAGGCVFTDFHRRLNSPLSYHSPQFAPHTHLLLQTLPMCLEWLFLSTSRPYSLTFRPPNPIEYLASYLLKNKDKAPYVQEASAASAPTSAAL